MDARLSRECVKDLLHPLHCDRAAALTLACVRVHQDWWTADSLGPAANYDVWEVIDDKLYVFMYDTPRQKFDEGDIKSEIQSGVERWEGWFGSDIVFNAGCMWYCATSDSEERC